jgi:hypothetical protein
LKEEKFSEKKDKKNYVCDHCSRTSNNGYDLICSQDRTEKNSLSLHFCSTRCLSRWVGERGWLYELYMKGIHDEANISGVGKEGLEHEMLRSLVFDS